MCSSRAIPVSENGSASWNQEIVTHHSVSGSPVGVTFELTAASNGMPGHVHDSVVIQLGDINWSVIPEVDMCRSEKACFRMELSKGGSLHLYLFKEVSSAEPCITHLPRYKRNKGNTPLFRSIAHFVLSGGRSISLNPCSDWTPIPIGGIQHTGSYMISRAQSSASPPASLIPLKLDDGIVIETSFKDGFRHEVIRSCCTFVNSTSFELEVCAEIPQN